MEVLALAVMGAVNILCFVIGAKVGQAVTQGKQVEVPSVNVLKAVKEHREKKKAEEDRDRMQVIMDNIEAYDGTAMGQREVPRG